jgi:hypothetical protein
MKNLVFAAFAGMAVIIATGCVRTQTGTHSPALTWSKDRVEGRYQRSVDQVYQASVKVITDNGVVIQEYIPHDTTNTTRSVHGKVNEKNVWISVEAVDPTITQVTVQARSSMGISDINLSHELEKEIALQLAR